MNKTESLFRLDGKVAIVTGGAGGIGSAVCRALADMGSSVAVTGRNGDKAAALAAELKDAGHVTRSRPGSTWCR